ITLRSCASAPLRLPVEVALATDLADLTRVPATRGRAAPSGNRPQLEERSQAVAAVADDIKNCRDGHVTANLVA
ncbi:hypothetical protein AB0R07_10575, partial [Streptomyces rochei]|uniref:hypothetical protein n=1 Tax=Streptomyces rochei TaxID=1928 RepID=UPI003415D7B8